MANHPALIEQNKIPAAKVRWGYILQEMVLIIVFSYLVFGASSSMGQLTPVIPRITAVLLSLSAITFLLIRPHIRPEWALPVLAAAAAMLTASVFAIQPDRSFGDAWNYFGSFFVFFFFSELIRRGLPGELIVKTMLIVGFVLMIWSWLPAVQWYLNWLALEPGRWLPDVTFRLPIPNMLAVLINFMTMLAIARLLFTTSLIPRIILSLFSLSGLALLYLSSSRGGWVGTAAGLTCLGLLSFHFQRDRWFSIWHWLRSRKYLRVIILLVTLIVVAAAAWLLFKQATHSTHPAFFSARGYLWEPAWRAFLDHPLTGIGLSNYSSYYYQIHSTPPNMMYIHAHSIYMEVMYSTGLLGLAAFGWLLFALLREFRHRFRKVTGFDRSLFAGAAAGLAAFLVHGFFDSVNTVPSMMTLLMFALAAGLASPSIVTPSSALQKWSGTSIQVLGILVAAFAWINIWQLSPVSDAVKAVHSGDLQKGVVLMTEASRRAPNSPFAFEQLGLMYSLQVQQGEEARLPDAVRAFQTASKLNPYWSLHPANLGALYRSQGDLHAARQAFQQAAALAPGWYAYWLQLAEIEELLGSAEAAAAYHQAFVLLPGWFPAEYWQASPLRSELYSKWISQAAPQSDPEIAQLESQYAADPSSYSSLSKLAKAYRDEGNWQQVERLLLRSSLLITEDEQAPLELQWLQAELAAQHGSFAEAVEMGEQVLSRYRQPGVYGPGSGRENYWELHYGRPGIWLEVVPQSAGLEFPSRLKQIEQWKTSLP